MALLASIAFPKRSLKLPEITNAEVLLMQYVDSQNFVSDYTDNNTVDLDISIVIISIITIDLGHLGQ